MYTLIKAYIYSNYSATCTLITASIYSNYSPLSTLITALHLVLLQHSIYSTIVTAPIYSNYSTPSTLITTLHLLQLQPSIYSNYSTPTSMHPQHSQRLQVFQASPSCQVLPLAPVLQHYPQILLDLVGLRPPVEV